MNDHAGPEALLVREVTNLVVVVWRRGWLCWENVVSVGVIAGGLVLGGEKIAAAIASRSQPRAGVCAPAGPYARSGPYGDER